MSLKNKIASHFKVNTQKNIIFFFDQDWARKQEFEPPEQLDEYIKKLRERLMVKLGKNKKIFIN